MSWLSTAAGAVGRAGRWAARGIGSLFADDNPVTGAPAGRGRRALNAVARGGRQTRQFVYDHAWAMDAASNMASRIGQFGNSYFGYFVHTIAVSVQGGPQASLRRVWYLALAAAFGRLRNRVLGVQACSIEAQWDVTGKACTVVIGYTNSGIVAGGQTFGAGVGQPVANSPLGPFQRGPDQVTIGGSWPAFLKAFNSSTTQGTNVRSLGGLLLDIANPLTGPAATGNAITALRQKIFGYMSGSGGTTVSQNPATGGGSSVPQPIFATVYELPGTRVPERLVKFAQSYNAVKANLFIELPKSTTDVTEFLPWSRVLPLGVTVSGPYGSTRAANNSLLPILPDDGRVITTGQKNDPRVQNPRPPIDGKTRGSIVSLVAQALTDPGILPPSPPAGYVPLHGPGVYIYDPGLGLENPQSLNGPFTEAVSKADTDLPDNVPSPLTPADAGFGPDGYPLQQVIPNVRE